MRAKTTRPTDGPTPRKRILWLLTFLERDVADLRAGELLDTWNDYVRHIFPADTDAFPDVEDVEDLYTGTFADVSFAELPETCRPTLQRFQDALRAGMLALHRGDDWAPFSTTIPAVTVTYRPVHGGLVRRYAGHRDLEAVAVVLAADLLVADWKDLRRCKRRGCGVFFIPSHGRQVFHDPRCSEAVRKQRFAAKGRDYQAEKQRRYELDEMKRARPGRKR